VVDLFQEEMTWIWIAAAVLLLAAAAAIWFTVPRWLPLLTAMATEKLWDIFAPKLFKRKTREEEALDHEAARQGIERPTKFRPHPGEH
jgi:hypothetical protein